MKKPNGNNDTSSQPINTSSRSKHIELIMFSDIQCPWCFLAKKRLDPILQSTRGSRIKLEWRPLELHPYIPAEGMDSRAFFRQYMGADSIIHERQAMVTKIGLGLGVQMDFSRMRKQPNTRLAHRLIAYAQDRDLASDVTEALFQGFFCEGVDIGDIDEVLNLLTNKSVPLDAPEVRVFLESDAGKTQLTKDLEAAHSLGIRGAPTYMRSDGERSGGFNSEAEAYAFLKM